MPSDWALGDKTVNRMGFGAMRLPGAPRERALEVLRAAAASGVNHIDTVASRGSGAGGA
jgi:pyridoxine 4-dehydrogenase